jgi:signal transduction histidine kinase/putative methionine-R-sulfoxide reductase with GAF domain
MRGAPEDSASSLAERARAWLSGNAWVPGWQPSALRHPFFSYLSAAAAVAMAAGLTLVLEHTLSSFSFHGMPGFLVLVPVAVTWGLGPAALGAILNGLVLNFIVIPPQVADTPGTLSPNVSHIVTFAISLFFGLAISGLASLGESRRRLLEQHRSQLLARTEAALHRLQAVQAVTDTALAHLPAQDLLQQLLARLAQALAVDNAALLLASEDGKSLVVYMARGAEEAQVGDLLIPIGQGIAGRIAESRQPLIVDDVSATEVANALLRETARSLAGVPVMVRDRLLGVLHADSTVPRHFTDEDIEVLQLVAERIALVIENARLYAEERQRSADLVAERDRLERILAALPVGVVIHDAGAQISVINGAAQALIGAAADPVVPRERQADLDGRIFGMDGSPCPPDAIPTRRSLKQGEEVRDQQLLVRNASTGQDIPVLASSTPLRDGSGEISGAVSVFQDISVLRTLEQQRDHVLATVAHDLRNPLTSISGMSQILQLRVDHVDGPMRERFAKNLKTIESAARRMTVQIGELLDYAQAQAGRSLDLTLESTDAVGLLRGVLQEHQDATEKHTLELRTSEEAIMVLVDPLRLERAIANLVVNAIKYSPQGGPIVVSVARSVGSDGRWLSIEVSDSGLGIPSADVPHIFEQYYRAGNVAATIPGTGIGLAGVRHMIEKHGGTVTLASTEGAGTTVTVRLPLLQDAEVRTGAVV